ncbi:MAG TPA: hypothetical protein PKW76_16945 [bacterium]|nr:hypothetical protein [bacterium]HPG47358.1 hypothetical protein [bacterium]HPM96710.1 hypothetical protein [bacterium]
MGYLIEFPLAEDGFDESIKEAIEEILYKRGIFGPARTKALEKAEEILRKYNTPMRIEVEFLPDIRLTQEEHKQIKDAFTKSLYNYKTEHNKMIRGLFIDLLSGELFDSNI